MCLTCAIVILFFLVQPLYQAYYECSLKQLIFRFSCLAVECRRKKMYCTLHTESQFSSVNERQLTLMQVLAQVVQVQIQSDGEIRVVSCVSILSNDSRINR